MSINCNPVSPYIPCFSGRLNVKQEEIDDMLKEAPGPINFTVFLTMFGEKLKGKRRCRYMTFKK